MARSGVHRTITIKGHFAAPRPRHRAKRSRLTARLVLRNGWRTFASVRLALFLILILAGLSLIGSLVIQVPPNTLANPDEYAWWLDNVASLKLGAWTTPVSSLGLFDVFHSPWFLGSGLLLIASIFACSVNRWGNVKRTITGTKTKLADQFYESGSNKVEFDGLNMGTESAATDIQNMLADNGYRVRTESEAGNVFLAGDKLDFVQRLDKI